MSQGQGQGQGHTNNKSLSTSASSFFATASHFVTPALPHYNSSSSRSREVLGLGDKGTLLGSFSGSGSGSGSGFGAQTGLGLGPSLGSGGMTGTAIGISNPGLDEDQKSDNTAPAGYMMMENNSSASESGTSFSDFLLPHPETMRYVRTYLCMYECVCMYISVLTRHHCVVFTC